jgi:HTH-type transcriptional regulator, glycine betaine synthesis regulator
MLRVRFPRFLRFMGNAISSQAQVNSRRFTKGGSMSLDVVEQSLNGEGDKLDHALSSFQQRSIDLFINAAAALSLPRSVGEIFGLFYSSEAPLSLNEVTAFLGISRGSASEGIRWLRGMGALKQVVVPENRREHFIAETSLRKLASGYLRDRIDPHLASGQGLLRELGEAVDDDSKKGGGFQRARANQVASWYRFIGRALPLIRALAGKF